MVAVQLQGAKHAQRVSKVTACQHPNRCPSAFPSLIAKWVTARTAASIRMSIPITCLFDGYDLDRLRVLTVKPGAHEGVDSVYSRPAISSG